MPAWSSPRPSSRRRAQHAVGPLAPQLAALDLHAAGHRGAERGQRHEVADGHVERAAADLQRPRRRRGRRRPAGSCRRRGAGAGRAPGHDDAVEALADAVDRLDRHAEVAQLRRRARPGRPRTARTRGARTEDGTFIRTAPGSGCRWRYSSRMSSTPWRIERQPVDAEAEGEAGPLLGVDADGANTLGCTMPQPPSSSQPVCAAGATARALAEDAVDVVLGRRLGEREVRRAAAGSGSRRRSRRVVKASRVPARSAKRDAPVDDQALDLVEHRHVGGVGGVAAEHPARA